MREPTNPRVLLTIPLMIVVCAASFSVHPWQRRCYAESMGAKTSTYVFDPAQSTVVQTGGIAHVNWTYSVQGWFELALDPNAGTAAFAHVDANATDDSPFKRTLDPNQVFNMTTLVGTVVDHETISFTGKADDGSDISITVTFENNLVHLMGQTTPPPHSADFFIFELDAVAQRKYGGGSGTAEDPYQIATAADLISLAESPEDYDKHFRLMADVDLSGYSYDRALIAPDANEVTWEYEGTAFTGVFDGNGHAVLHLTITGKSYLGLFGRLGSEAEVTGLGVVDANVTGSYYAVGALVGDNFRGSITTCYSTGTITGYTRVGGLVGYNQYGNIATSYSICAVSATASGNQAIGGLVGFNAGRTTTSYSSGDVSGERVVGGLVGQTTGSIAMCYSTGMVSADHTVGGLLGERHPAAGIVAGCFWDIETSGQAASAGGTGKTTAEMQTASTFLDPNAGWDFVGETGNGPNDIWTICEGIDYPRLAWEPNCIGCTHEDYLEWVSVGKPECWCYPTQCHGDADGLVGGSAKSGYYHVGPADLNVFISAWLVKEPPHGPGIASIRSGICADFTHDYSGSVKVGTYRVGPSDLCILVANWLVKEPPHGPGLPANCSECP